MHNCNERTEPRKQTMRSPIARGLIALARMLEWGHRRIHGPQYAPGDVVEVRDYDGELMEVELMRLNQVGAWWIWTPNIRHIDPVVSESDIIRVVRYGEGE